MIIPPFVNFVPIFLFVLLTYSWNNCGVGCLTNLVQHISLYFILFFFQLVVVHLPPCAQGIYWFREAGSLSCFDLLYPRSTPPSRHFLRWWSPIHIFRYLFLCVHHKHWPLRGPLSIPSWPSVWTIHGSEPWERKKWLAGNFRTSTQVAKVNLLVMVGEGYNQVEQGADCPAWHGNRADITLISKLIARRRWYSGMNVYQKGRN